MKDAKRKIKILQVCAIDETIKSLLLPLVDRLTSEGFDVTSCCSKGKNSEELRAKGYKIKNVEIARSINLISNLKSIIELSRLMKAEKFDIVHVHTPVAAILARVAAKISGVPLIIYTAHGFYFHDRMARYKYNIIVRIEKIAGRYFSDFIFAQSEEDRNTAVKEGIISVKKICTIGNGVDVFHKFNPEKVDLELIKQLKIELKLDENDKVIMFLGRMVKEKGIIELIEAFNAINKDNYKLIIVGDRFTAERDTTTYSNVIQIVESNKNIIMTGRRSDISNLLFLSNVFVLPSYREGMPRSIIEAMAMGKPVIATNIRGCREEVVDGETGFLVEVGSAEEIREKIIEILENPELERSMGIKARQRAEELFDEEKVLDKQMEIINRLVEKMH